MIDREFFSYIKNILDIDHNIDLSALYNTLTTLKNNPEKLSSELINNAQSLEKLQETHDLILKSIKDENFVDFYINLINLFYNIDTTLLHNVLKCIKDKPEIHDTLLDSFSNNQIESKSRLLDAINRLDILNKDSTVVIWGSWYGSILIPSLASNVKNVLSIDLDDGPLQIAKRRLFTHYNNIDYRCNDVFDRYIKAYLNTNLIINTSCEHMRPMKDWEWFRYSAMEADTVYPKGYSDTMPNRRKVYKEPKISNNCYFAFQSNNMDWIGDHTNCVYSIEEFKSQLPERAEVLYEEEVNDTRGTRFMLVGKLMPL